MKFLVIGGTGTISGGMAQEALTRRHEVTILNRGNNSYRVPDGVTVIHADINDYSKMNDIINDCDYDVVVDPLVLNLDQLKNHLRIFDGHCKKYVYISSCCAYGCANVIINENHLHNPKSKYGIEKDECERYLKSANLKSNYLIIRPYITYGDIRIPIPFACRKNPYTVLDRIINEKPLVCFDIVNHKTTHNLMDIRDFSRMAVSIIEECETSDHFNVCGDNVYDWDTAYDLLYKTVGKPKHLYYVNKEVFKYLDYHLYEDIKYDKDCNGTVYSNKKAKAFILDQTKQIELKEGIERLVSYLSNNSADLPLEDSFNFSTDMLLINAVQEKDAYLQKYVQSLDRGYVIKLKYDWKKRVIKYYLRKTKGKLLPVISGKLH